MRTIFTQHQLLDGRTSIFVVKEFIMGNSKPLGHDTYILMLYGRLQKKLVIVITFLSRSETVK